MSIQNNPIRTLTITLVETAHYLIMDKTKDTMLINRVKNDIEDVLDNDNIQLTPRQVQVLQTILDTDCHKHLKIAKLMDEAVAEF